MTNIITLLSDFGSQDGYTAAMLGYLHTHAPTHKLQEVSHNIEPQNIWQAAMALKRYSRHFPANTIHLVVVDPGVGSERQAIALKCDDHWLVGPNNGVLSLASQQYRSVTAYALKNNTPWWQKHHSFDGLALFAPASARLATHPEQLLEFADAIENYHQLTFPTPELIGDHLVGQIITFDRFGNAITNIEKADIPHQSDLIAQCQQQQFPLRPFYCDASADGRLSLINADNLLELALYQSSLQQNMSLEVGDSVSVRIK
jgi:hypothetical protein